MTTFTLKPNEAQLRRFTPEDLETLQSACLRALDTSKLIQVTHKTASETFLIDRITTSATESGYLYPSSFYHPEDFLEKLAEVQQELEWDKKFDTKESSLADSPESPFSPIPTSLKFLDQSKVELMRELLLQYQQDETFLPGDVVRQIPGLNKKKESESPMIVVKVLATPKYATTADPGSPYFGEKLDIICAELLDGILVFFHFDRNRLTKVTN